MPQKRLESVTHIEASIELVWAHMTNVSKYVTWNPFVIEAQSDGDPNSPGTILSFRVKWHDGGSASSKERINHVQQVHADADGVQKAEWVYNFHSIFTKIGMIKTSRKQSLLQEPGQATVYTNEFVMAGWGSGVAPWNKIEIGMNAQMQAMKALCERA